MRIKCKTCQHLSKQGYCRMTTVCHDDSLYTGVDESPIIDGAEDERFKRILCGTGTKYDDGKPDLTLLDIDFLTGTATAMGHGESKYGYQNWCGGIKYRRLIAAAYRHLICIANGQDTDKESGLLHVDHVSANMNMLRGMMRLRPECDDRVRTEIEKRETESSKIPRPEPQYDY